MAFFDGDFFKKKFFKNPFFGESFYQEPFFDDTTIAHGITGGTNSATEIGIVLNRAYVGTLIKPAIFTVIVDGVENVVSGVSAIGKDLVLTMTDGMAFGQTIRVSYEGEDTNNVGILVNDYIANTIV